MTRYWQDQKDGSFAITEQGDLGLGLTRSTSLSRRIRKTKTGMTRNPKCLGVD